MKIKEKFRSIYFNYSPLSKEDYQRSRFLFVFESSAANAILNLTSGAFLAGFAQYLGANDQFNGMIAAIPTLAGVIQIFSPMVFEKLARRKFLISIFCLLYRLLLGFIVFIPLLVSDKFLRLVLLFSVYLSAYLMSSFVTPAASNWIISLTPNRIRGRYFGRKDSYSLAFVTVVNLVMGKVLDIFKESGNTYTGFIYVFTFVIILTVANFTFLSSVKEPEVAGTNVPVSIRNIFTVPVKDRRFRKILALFILWNAGLQIGGPFFGVYVVTGLKLKYTYIMLVSMLSSLSSVFTARVWGRLADKKSWVYTTKMSIGMLAGIHLTWFLVSIDNAFYLVPLLYIFSGAAWAGINLSLFNIQFKYSPEEGRTVYLGFNAAVGGIMGFSTALLGSVIVGRLEGLKLSVAGFTIGNMQVVFGLSGILLVVCAVFIHKVLSRDANK